MSFGVRVTWVQMLTLSLTVCFRRSDVNNLEAYTVFTREICMKSILNASKFWCVCCRRLTHLHVWVIEWASNKMKSTNLRTDLVILKQFYLIIWNFAIYFCMYIFHYFISITKTSAYRIDFLLEFKDLFYFYSPVKLWCYPFFPFLSIWCPRW